MWWRAGKDFAQLVNQYLQSQGQETRAPAVIQSNPDQSKHLETARMKLGGLWVRLCVRGRGAHEAGRPLGAFVRAWEGRA